MRLSTSIVLAFVLALIPLACCGMGDPSQKDVERYQSDLVGMNVEAAKAYMKRLGLEPTIVHGELLIGRKPTSRCADLSFNELRVHAQIDNGKVTSAEVFVQHRPADM